jgi:hypothetical protein
MLMMGELDLPDQARPGAHCCASPMTRRYACAIPQPAGHHRTQRYSTVTDLAEAGDVLALLAGADARPVTAGCSMDDLGRFLPPRGRWP